MHILVVEDDTLLASGLVSALSNADYKVTHAANGKFACGVLLSHEFDLVILDLGLPDMEGIHVLQEVRKRKCSTPVIVLTARDGVEQQVSALDAGADDYMEKPFDLRKLEARIRALIRRSHGHFEQDVEIGPLLLAPFKRNVRLRDKPIELPAREYEVLEVLALQYPGIVNKERLAQRLAMDSEDIGDNAVEVYIHRLRRRLANSGIGIRTARGVGYSLVLDK